MPDNPCLEAYICPMNICKLGPWIFCVVCKCHNNAMIVCVDAKKAADRAFYSICIMFCILIN